MEENEPWLPFIYLNDDEEIPSTTSVDQDRTEDLVMKFRKHEKRFDIATHCSFLLRFLAGMPKQFIPLSIQEPWIPYWILNALSILRTEEIPEVHFSESGIIRYLSKRISKSGGYSSSPEQPGHLILCYTAINTLSLIGTKEAFDSIDRKSIYKWILTLKLPNGSFEALPGAEADARSTYCALSVCDLLGILTPEITRGAAEFILSCQNYDGGFSPNPGVETHGGFTFCSIAALKILGRLKDADIKGAVRWCASRQMPYCGGFNGRTNKLVDTCYTWWVGAASRILADYLGIPPFWNEDGIANWVVSVCQSESGGFFDKPGKKADLFHTMYGLAGLSAACREKVAEQTGFMLEEIDPVHGVTKAAANKMKNYFIGTDVNN